MGQTLFNANQIGPNTAIVRQDFTATAAQTNFVTTGAAFSGGILLVYVGGALLKLTDDYTISGTHTVVLNTGVSAGVLVTTILMTPISSFIPPFTAVPTRTVLTSGSGTYNTPSGARQLRIRMVGGGAGGGAATTNDGAAGGNTTFGALTASGGAAGIKGTGATSTPPGGGAGGAASGGDVNIPGGGGGSGIPYSGSTGGNSAFGGGALGSTYAVAGGNAAANSGGGGGGGSSNGTPAGGSGGGAGGYVDKIIDLPASTYSYSVGAGGAGGAAGVYAGGNGAAGIIIVEELY